MPAMPATATGPAYARLTEAFPALRVTEEAPRSGDGWVGAHELAAGGAALDAFLAWDEHQVLRDHGQYARPDVIAGFGLHRYAWPACLLFTVPWFLHRRVPRLPVSDVSFHRTRGRLTVRTRTFSCLPGDPAAALPGARVVRTEEALRLELRSAIAEHLGPLLDGFRPRLRRGRRALWGMATDEVTEGLWRVGHLLGEGRRAMSELTELLPDTTPTAPYTGGAGFRDLRAPGRLPAGVAARTRDRIACCLFYTLRPAETCATCPRTCDADRIERLAAVG
ncbi:(2Fe-2S)-binding protein [Streptomyces sp. H10-C2]|uniref:(2Fe-2S)-binding protein n=1 Tax=unclassified Streptomyces TaxID=2593676 RepID=UPI0024B9E316|nr:MULTISPECIES: (2Fe-2S)-binding protein [unclassified Streptomyces]MDJ0340739.1 (2Fe-2S)-binding protein [Streptomyces sp. PH10-H1]MDJ0371989.1 (2Fe-2S)-binding protein [Streptomyces sp. H10-C2]